MTTEIFLSLLSDFLNKRETLRLTEGINWEELIKVAKLHEMAGIILCQCRDSIPNKYRETLEQVNASTLFYYANRLKEENIILRKLRESGVHCFIIKGSTVAAYYPIPALRTMGDTDIVVNDVNKAHEVLMASGCRCKTKNAAYYKNDLLFEIHDHLTYETVINSPKLVSFFNDFWKYVKDGELDCSFHLLFLILHLRSHFYGSGVGIRQFVDIAVVTKYNDKLDWLWIEEKLKEYGMWPFAQRVFGLNYRWFGINTPVAVESVDEEFYKEATLELCSGGVFGHSGNNAREIAVYGGIHPFANMIKRAWCMVFVPYKNMMRLPQFEFLVGHPYLLPVAWIYRGWLTVKRRGLKRITQSIQASFVSKEDIKEQKDYLDTWSH